MSHPYYQYAPATPVDDRWLLRFVQGRLQSWLRQVRTLYEPVPYRPSYKKNTTIMTSRPIILHQRLYFSAYTPPTLAINGMADSPEI